jgi:hypothetical protein
MQRGNIGAEGAIPDETRFTMELEFQDSNRFELQKKVMLDIGVVFSTSVQNDRGALVYKIDAFVTIIEAYSCGARLAYEYFKNKK